MKKETKAILEHAKNLEKLAKAMKTERSRLHIETIAVEVRECAKICERTK